MSLILVRLLCRCAKHRTFSAGSLAVTRAFVAGSHKFDGHVLSPLHKYDQPRLFSTSFEAGDQAAVDDEQDSNDFLSIENPHWIQAGLNPNIIRILNQRGINSFTPVQGEAVEPIIEGRDVIGRSRTGTGKTLAFGLPSMVRLVNLTREKGTRDDRGRMARGRNPSMVILCPTRELARQVSDELSPYAQTLGLYVSVFHGGVSYNPQMEALQNGIDILVGTPGRINDHISSGNLDLSDCNISVLDEADEMLAMGFSQQVEQILSTMGSANREKTQHLMFSATTPDWVKDMGRRFQKDAFAIDSTGDEGGARVANTVRHLAVRIPRGVQASSILENIIRLELSKRNSLNDENTEHVKRNLGKAIIFTTTKREADSLVMSGVFHALSAASLHGDHSQRQRDDTLDRFRQGSFNVLVATDVAARGIDVKDVDLVLQFGPPTNADTYVHRSGRTGRAGRKGISLLLFGDHQKRDLIVIERELGHDFQFEIAEPPSDSDIMTLTAETSIRKLEAVPDHTVEQFRESAEALLSESQDPVALVSRCLAALSSRPKVSSTLQLGFDDDGIGRGGSARESRDRNRSSGRSFNNRSGGFNRHPHGRNSYKRGRHHNMKGGDMYGF